MRERTITAEEARVPSWLESIALGAREALLKEMMEEIRERAGAETFEELGEMLGRAYVYDVDSCEQMWVDYNAQFIEGFIHDPDHAAAPSFFARLREAAGLSEDEMTDLGWAWLYGVRIPEDLRRKKYGRGR